MAEKIVFTCDGLQLEGLLTAGTNCQAAVITHPHPLYGGDMGNTVVGAMADAYAGLGCTTLRFNFRGVGRSQGKHDQGQGEQRDALAAVSYAQQLETISTVFMAGYSFGSWVNMRAAAQSTRLLPQIMVSPPVAFMDFGSPAKIPGLELVVTGASDDIAPVNKINRYLSVWNRHAPLEVIAGADHFYAGCLGALKQVLVNHANGEQQQ